MIGRMLQSLYTTAHSVPAAPALLDERGTLCFGDLLAAVRRLRAALEHEGALPGDRIALCCENSVECVVAMYAILDAGCAFVPLSPRDPDLRLERLLSRARVKLTLLSAKRELRHVGRTLDMEELVGEAIDAESTEPLANVNTSACQDEALAYVIFTSGTTGEPKGVCIPNHSFFHASLAAAKAMALDEHTRSLAILPLHFDGSYSSVFAPLVAGGSVFVHRGSICPPSRLQRLLSEYELTHSTFTPTYLRALLADPSWSPQSFPSWKTLALGGEEPPRVELNRLRAELPELKVFNRYGPTEATMAVSTLEITNEMLQSDERIPLGVPHPGVEFVEVPVDEGHLLSGEGAELFIGGAQLMQGYLDDPEGTKAVLGPFLGDGRQLLKTGDLVTRDGSGRYVFLERVDNVVKRNGTRIALSEIEAALTRVAFVTTAACVKVKSGEDTRIVAFLSTSEPRPSERAIRRELLQVLPASMSPDEIRFVDALPGTTGGKIDRNALSLLARTPSIAAPGLAPAPVNSAKVERSIR